MDILLLVVTIVSLLIALCMGIAAWGMWREERARSAARVAALSAAAAGTDDEPAARAPLQPVGHGPSEPAPPARNAPPWSAPADWRRLPKLEHAQPAGGIDALGDSFLGSAVTTPESGGRQRGLAIAACVLFVAILLGAYFTVYRGERGNPHTSAAGEVTSDSPLELISLRHERQDGALAITGLVRNPSGGHNVAKLAAVALLFDERGEFVTSSRAGVDYTQLAPGDESPFVIRVAAPANVARYRVSFRTDAGVVPHIDRRGQEPIARDVP